MADTVRAAFLAGYAELARQLGLDPLRMLDGVGIPRVALTQPDLRVSTVAGRDLLEASARTADDFGLRMSELRTPSALGPVALVFREQPTLRGVLTTIARYNTLHSAAHKFYLDESDDTATFRLVSRYPTPGPCRQATELAMSQALRILCSYLGPAWRPISTCFVHAAPKSLGTHHRIFGSNVLFEQELNGLTFERDELNRLNPAADPAMAREAERYIDGLVSAEEDTLSARVGELAHALLPMGYCTMQFIAGQLGLEPRTLQRQLAEEGTSFLEIVQNTRKGLVSQYLDQSERPLAEVADLLGFSALSAFSRWYKVHYGRSASAHRERSPARA